MKSPVKYNEDFDVKIIEYTNSSAETVSAGGYKVLTLTKSSNDSVDGYTFMGVSEVYSGNLRLPLTLFLGVPAGGATIYVCNPSSTDYSIPAGSAIMKLMFAKL